MSIWFADIIATDDFCFKAIGGQSSMGTIMRLTHTSGSMMLMQLNCSNDDMVQKSSHSIGKEDEVEAWLDHVQPVIMILYLAFSYGKL